MVYCVVKSCFRLFLVLADGELRLVRSESPEYDECVDHESEHETPDILNEASQQSRESEDSPVFEAPQNLDIDAAGVEEPLDEMDQEVVESQPTEQAIQGTSTENDPMKAVEDYTVEDRDISSPVFDVARNQNMVTTDAAAVEEMAITEGSVAESLSTEKA